MHQPAASMISIIIPTYNYAHTLERAVSSVCNQTDHLCEVMIINDGSTDNTQEILENLKIKYDKIVVVNKPNGGAASTRNLGISLSKGKYLIFLDADDELCPEAINNIRHHIQRHPNTQFIIGGHYSVSMDGKKKLHRPSRLSKDPHHRLKSYLIDKTISVSNGASVVHKSVFTDYRYPEQFRNAEDIPMFAYILARFECGTLDFPLANIYKHNDSLRHNVKFSEDVGLNLVEEVFDIKRIPEKSQSLKKDFYSQRLLSLSRVCYESKRYYQSTQYFKQAFQQNNAVIFKWSYFKKFIISVLMLTISGKY